MPARLLSCPACHRTLGTISRKRDHRGRPYDKVVLTDSEVRVGRSLFRGEYAECRCGERVSLAKGTKFEYR